MEFHRLTEEHVDAVATLFVGLDDPHFTPHAFTRDMAEQVCRYSGRDGFYGGFHGADIVSYGMLRGWDAGFDDPSLGIAVHPAFRGRGIGRRTMLFLHQEAARRGARRIRLRVHPDNLVAIAMYEQFGYVFDGSTDRGQRVAWYDISQQ